MNAVDRSSLARALLCGALAIAATAASAQQIWKWRDANGQMHISDQPPPAGATVISKPAGAQAPAPAPAPAAEPQATASASAAPAAAAASKPSVDPELAKRKAAADKKRQEAEQANADAQKKVDAQNCAAAKEQLRALNSGMRLSRVNEKGEREILDDKQRAEQGRQAQKIVDSSCH